MNFKIFGAVGHIFGIPNFSPGRGKLRDSLRTYQPHCQEENDKRNQQPCSFLKILAGRGSSMISELSTGRGKMFPYENRVGLSKFFQDFFWGCLVIIYCCPWRCQTQRPIALTSRVFSTKISELRPFYLMLLNDWPISLKFLVISASQEFRPRTTDSLLFQGYEPFVWWRWIIDQSVQSLRTSYLI